MAGVQFALEDKARTEQKYKKQIQLLQVQPVAQIDILITVEASTSAKFTLKILNPFGKFVNWITISEILIVPVPY